MGLNKCEHDTWQNLRGGDDDFCVGVESPLKYLDFKHEFWAISAANMMYSRLRNYTNMVVDKHGTQTFEVVVVMLLPFDVLVPYFFGQVVCPNILTCQKFYINVPRHSPTQHTYMDSNRSCSLCIPHTRTPTLKSYI